MNALLRFARVFESDDPRDQVELGANDSLAAKSDQKQRRTIDHWLSTQANSDDILADLFTDLDYRQLQQNFYAGDDAENGRLIAARFRQLIPAIDSDGKYWRDET